VQDGVFDIWVPLLVFSPFVFDATATVLRRAFRGEKIWEAHRTHYYQRLVLCGWGHRKTLGLEYALMALCVVAALLYQSMADTGRAVLLAIWMLGFAGLAVGVGLMEQRAMRQGWTNEG
jgi:UDP-N-acetylmuramyl pentapeptide phosphotransferase/UDP-N-acetylglucosamine-1-phosphate transferase